MAMQFLSGKDGIVKVSSTTLNITGWSFSPEAKIEDTTNTGDLDVATQQTFETHIPTVLGAKGNFKADWDALAVPTATTPNLQPGQNIALKLYFTRTGSYINIPKATVTSLPITSEVKGKISFQCDFQVNGVYTLPAS